MRRLAPLVAIIVAVLLCTNVAATTTGSVPAMDHSARTLFAGDHAAKDLYCDTLAIGLRGVCRHGSYSVLGGIPSSPTSFLPLGSEVTEGDEHTKRHLLNSVSKFDHVVLSWTFHSEASAGIPSYAIEQLVKLHLSSLFVSCNKQNPCNDIEVVLYAPHEAMAPEYRSAMITAVAAAPMKIRVASEPAELPATGATPNFLKPSGAMILTPTIRDIVERRL